MTMPIFVLSLLVVMSLLRSASFFLAKGHGSLPFNTVAGVTDLLIAVNLGFVIYILVVTW